MKAVLKRSILCLGLLGRGNQVSIFTRIPSCHQCEVCIAQSITWVSTWSRNYLEMTYHTPHGKHEIRHTLRNFMGRVSHSMASLFQTPNPTQWPLIPTTINERPSPTGATCSNSTNSQAGFPFVFSRLESPESTPPQHRGLLHQAERHTNHSQNMPFTPDRLRQQHQ